MGTCEAVCRLSWVVWGGPTLVERVTTLTRGLRHAQALGCILFTMAFFTQPFQDGGSLQIINGENVHVLGGVLLCRR
jgi:hypothetical protein